MIKDFEWKIAKRYMGYDNQFFSLVSYLASIGIALGVMTLIIVMSVMNGYEEELVKKILGINGHLTIHQYKQEILNSSTIIEDIQKIESVQYVAPLVTGQALLKSNEGSMGVIVRGMDIESLNRKPIMSNAFVTRSNKSVFHANEVYIGDALARKLGLFLDDKITLIVPNLNSTILGNIPQIKTFYIAGVFDVGMHEYNISTVFIPINTAKLLFGIGKSITEIEVILHHIKDIKEVKRHINKHVYGQEILITDWGMENHSLINALRVERSTMFLILLLIIVIASFSIISGLVMLVKEKYKSIAILRAIGVTRASIIKIFILAGFFLGFVGTVFGSIIGILFVINIKRIKEMLELVTGVNLFDPIIYLLTSLPSKLDILEIISIVVISMLLSLIATIYPAWQAGRMLPADALRYE